MRPRLPLPPASQPEERWGLAFMTDPLGNGRRSRVLTVVALDPRKGVLLAADFSLTAPQVVAAVESLKERGRRPPAIPVDKGSEFASQAMASWTSLRTVRLAFLRPGRPVENAYSERFTGTLRDEGLTAHLFFSLTEVRHALALGQEDYKRQRAHHCLGGLSPREFRSQLITEGAVRTFSTLPWS
jgi:putative transposase